MSVIFGIGIDIVHVPRVEKLLDIYGDHFAGKILTPEEFVQFKEVPPIMPAKFLAKRFAAKEAVVKALGTGFSGGISLRQIQVVHDALGKPGLAFSGNITKVLKRYHIKHTQLSTSDEKEYVVAFVVMSTA